MTTRITVKEGQEIIKKEIEWCESPEAQAVDTSDDYKAGFVAGLNQAIFLLDSFRADEYAERIARDVLEYFGWVSASKNE